MKNNLRRLLAMSLVCVLAFMCLPDTKAYASITTNDTANPVNTETLNGEEETEDTETVDSLNEVDETTSSAQTTESTSAVDVVESEMENQTESQMKSEVNETASETSEPGALNYIYVESPVLYTPDTQNIVVSIGEEDIHIDSAILHYKIDGTSVELTAETSIIENNLLLFSIDFPEDIPADIYSLTGITYSVDGETFELDLSDEDLYPAFGVNMEYGADSDEDISLEDIEMEVVTIDEDGNETSQNSIEEAIVSAQAEAVTSSSLLSRTAVAATTSGNIVVVLDPGHDSRHPGTSGNGLYEHELNLKIAQYCKAELEEYQGVTVYMTRSTNACPWSTTDSICLANRVAYAKSVGATVFVSIHLNSEENGTSANGAEVYYPNSNYKAAIGAEGKALAQSIQNQLAALGLSNRGIIIRNTENGSTYSDGSAADYYSVIWRSKEAGFPAIIVEHAFLSNSSNANYLKSEANLKKLGVADATGIASTYGLTKEVTNITSNAITIANVDKVNGTFDVKITGVSPNEKVKQIQFPVWSKSDQSDIKWYIATNNGNGTYSCTIDLSNHNYNEGTYQIHSYAKDIYGKLHFLKGTSQAIQLEALSTPVITAVGNTTQTQYTLTAKEVALRGGVSAVKFAVWSSTNGQDDLVWYSAKQASGIWTANAIISNHKTAGTYNVHVYAYTASGVGKHIATKTFTVDGPSVKKVEVTNKNESQGTFDIIISGAASTSGITSVQVPVWSTSNQSDIKWYTAARQGDDTYKVTVDIANHKYNYGTYSIHVYAKDENGINKCVATTSQKLSVPPPTITATGNSTQTKYTVSAKNVSLLGGVKNVKFAVWSEINGQDDLAWYSGDQTSQGDWSYNVNIANHKSAGTYSIHVYATNTVGSLQFLGSTKFTVAGPSLNNINAIENDSNNGTFEVTITGVTSAAGIKQVQVPIWSESNQSDIKWYTATQQSDGSTYKLKVDVSNHNYNYGTYKIHVYVTDKNDIQKGWVADSITLRYSIMGTTSVTKAQMVSMFNASGCTYPKDVLGKSGANTIEEFVQIYIEEAKAEGVKAEVAFAQAMHETGYLKFGGTVNISQNNFCGLGATEGGGTGACFDTVRLGVRAQIQHLKAYASTAALNNTCVDPRFSLVKRGSAQYVEWLGQQENPNGYGWATAANYGYKILSLINKMI